MAKTAQDFTIYQGEDITLQYDITDENDAVLSMTGGSLAWEANYGEDNTTAAISKTPSIGNGSGTDDRATVTLAAADTQNLTPFLYHTELRLTDSGGNDTVLAEGTMTLNPSTTK